MSGDGSHERAVTALVQTGPRGVDGEGDAILENRDFDGKQRSPLGKPGGSVRLFELFDDRLLDDRLAVANTVKLGADRFPSDGELSVARDPARPIEGGRPIEELAEVARLEGAELQQDAVGAAKPEVRSANRVQIGKERHAAIRDGLSLVAQSLQFAGNDGFQAKARRRNQFNLVIARHRPARIVKNGVEELRVNGWAALGSRVRRRFRKRIR